MNSLNSNCGITACGIAACGIAACRLWSAPPPHLPALPLLGVLPVLLVWPVLLLALALLLALPGAALVGGDFGAAFAFAGGGPGLEAFAPVLLGPLALAGVLLGPLGLAAPPVIGVVAELGRGFLVLVPACSVLGSCRGRFFAGGAAA